MRRKRKCREWLSRIVCRRTVAGCIVLMGVGLAGAEPTMASTELPSPYDARSVGMGGTGVAHIHNGASVYHNPAALHEVGVMAATACFAPGASGLSGPVEGPDTSTSSAKGFNPLFLVGGAYRLAKRLVVGAAIYPTGGFGATYKNVVALGGQELKIQVTSLEFSPVVTYSILDNLALSVGWRLTRMTESMSMPTTGPDGLPAIANVDQSGVSFLGLQAGVYYRPIDRLRLGVVYRSKVTTKLEGSTTVGGAKTDSSTEISNPHGFKLGVAVEAIPAKLLVAADVKYLLYEESSKEMVSVMKTPAGDLSTTQTLDWKNAFSGYLGLEFLATPMIPVRAGYNFTTSATPKSRPSPLMMPPGIVHGPSVGAGLRLGQWEVDVGGYYSFGKTKVAAESLALDAGMPPGEYGTTLWFISASATYRR